MVMSKREAVLEAPRPGPRRCRMSGFSNLSPSSIIIARMSLAFWKPGTSGPGSNLDRASEVEETFLPYAPSNSIQLQREQLPIYKHRMTSLFSLLPREDELNHHFS